MNQATAGLKLNVHPLPHRRAISHPADRRRKTCGPRWYPHKCTSPGVRRECPSADPALDRIALITISPTRQYRPRHTIASALTISSPLPLVKCTAKLKSSGRGPLVCQRYRDTVTLRGLPLVSHDSRAVGEDRLILALYVREIGAC